MNKIIDAQLIELRLLLEGIDFPIVNAQIMEALGQAPMLSVNVGTNCLANMILPGTYAQLFYNGFLIFEGLMSSKQILNSSSSKSVMLNFAGLGSLLDRSYIYDINFKPATEKNRAFFVSSSKMNGYGYKGTPESIQTAKKQGETAAVGAERNFILSSVSPVNSIIAKLFQSLNAGVSVNTIITDIITEALSNNPYLSKINSRIGFTNRVHIVPNSRELMDKVVDGIMMINYMTSALQTDIPQDVMTIKQLLDKVCDYLGYELVQLAAPINHNGVPKSLIFKPKAAFGCPILCNTLFPNQYTDLTVVNNYMSEPTRYSANTAPVAMNMAGGKVAGYLLSIAPSAYVQQEGGVYTFGLTKEEQYKGVVAYQEQMADYLSQAFIETNNKSDLATPESIQNATGQQVDLDGTITEITQQDVEGVLKGKSSSYINQVQDMVDRRFCELRGAAHNGSFTAAYSPYRLVGFEGVLLEEEHFPTVLGKFSSITSIIDANGNATQAVTLTHCYEFLFEGYKEPTYVEDRNKIPHIPIYLDGNFEFKSIGNQIYKPLLNASSDRSIYHFYSQGGGNEAPNKAGETEENRIVRIGSYGALTAYKLNADNEYKFSRETTFRSMIVSGLAFTPLQTLQDRVNLALPQTGVVYGN